MATTRRTFLAAAAAAPALLSGCHAADPRRARGKDGKLRLMVIGLANRGAANLDGVSHEEIAVLCDVDAAQLRAASQRFPNARTVADYRTVLLDPAATAQLDGVVVSTPDHSHYLPAKLAMRAGLDVYCEKPLTLTVAQARELRELAAASGAVTQMGTQIHTYENYHRVVEAIRAGAVGQVQQVIVFVNGTDWSAKELPQEQAPPADLDYDLWLGEVAQQPYRRGFHPAAWRRYWAFGGGTTADMSCHYTDLAFWALNLQAPVALTSDGDEPHETCAPKALRCTYEFAAPTNLRLHWHAGGDRPTAQLAERGLEKWRNGVLFVGDRGWLISNYDGHEIGPESCRTAFAAPAPYLPVTPSHYREWTDACRTRQLPSCHFGYSGLLTETVLLANAAFRAARGVRVTWDVATGKSDHAGVNQQLTRERRVGWA